MSILLRHAAALAGMVLACATTHAGNTNQAIENRLSKGQHAAYELVFKRLQTAVANHDEPGVAELIQYPLIASINDHILIIKNRQDFLTHYAQVMTPKVAQAVGRQHYGDLTVDDSGLTFDHGEIQIAPVCEDRACRYAVPKVVDIRP